MPRGRKPKDPNAVSTPTVSVFNLALQLRRILQNVNVEGVEDVKIMTEPFTSNKTLYVKTRNGQGIRVDNLLSFAGLVAASHGYRLVENRRPQQEENTAQ